MTVHVDRSVRLPETEFFAEPQRKTGIALHHTVGGDARTTVAHWRTDRAPGGGRKCIATASVIERDGTVFEVFDPAAWACQFGLRWPLPARLAFEKRFIGIELASEGGLIERDGILYAFDTVSPRTLVARAEAFDWAATTAATAGSPATSPSSSTPWAAWSISCAPASQIPRQYPDRPFDHYGDALAVGRLGKAGQLVKHHVFLRRFAQYFAERINIHQHVMVLPQALHQAIHRGGPAQIVALSSGENCRRRRLPFDSVMDSSVLHSVERWEPHFN